MPPASRLIGTFRYAVFFDGVDDYAVIEPFTVYGWSEITIVDYVYIYRPKPNTYWSKSNMIGDCWTQYASTGIYPYYTPDYTYIPAAWWTRKPDGTRAVYEYNIIAYVNQFAHVVRRFTTSREYSVYVNAVKVRSWIVPANEITVLEQNPDTATYPERYRRFTIGANVLFFEYLKLMQYQLLIYSRALSDEETLWNYRYPDSPVRNGLVLWLQAHPDNIKDIDGDGRLEWVDLSGYGNHGKIYGATLVEVIKAPSRVLAPSRILPPAR